jgi:hypothetical protein
MNALTTTTPGRGEQSNPLMPTTLDEAVRLAKIMSEMSLVPSHLQGKVADCMLVVEMAVRWRMSPFAVAQATSVLQGKLNYEGKLVAAALQTSGVLSSRLRYDYDGEGDSRTVLVSASVQGEAEPRSVLVKLREVRTQNKMWTSQPDQQLAYAGARIWGRRHAPEVMLGVYAPEEFDDTFKAEPRPIQSTVVRPSLGQQGLTKQDIDETLKGDDIPALASPWIVVSRDGVIKDTGDAKAWAAEWFLRVRAVRGAKKLDDAGKAATLAAMNEANVETFTALDQAGHGAAVTDVIQLIADAIADFTAPAEPAEPEDEFLEATE